jgi:hypothetical protein
VRVLNLVPGPKGRTWSWGELLDLKQINRRLEKTVYRGTSPNIIRIMAYVKLSLCLIKLQAMKT